MVAKEVHSGALHPHKDAREKYGHWIKPEKSFITKSIITKEYNEIDIVTRIMEPDVYLRIRNGMIAEVYSAYHTPKWIKRRAKVKQPRDGIYFYHNFKTDQN